MITREVHKHEVNPRIQPIVDRKYLPTKHYLETEAGELVEISADEAKQYGEPIMKCEHITEDSIADEFPHLPLEPVSESNKVDPTVNAMEETLKGLKSSESKRPGIESTSKDIVAKFCTCLI